MASREAIELLAPAFLDLPGAFGHWMLTIVQQYLGRCETLGKRA